MTSPGWFSDPWQPGGWRWWDGRSWTGHTAAHPAGRPLNASLPADRATTRARGFLALVTVAELGLVPMTMIFLMFLPASCRTVTCKTADTPLGVTIWFAVPGLLLAAWVTLFDQRVPPRWTVGLAITSALLCAAVLGSLMLLHSH